MSDAPAPITNSAAPTQVIVEPAVVVTPPVAEVAPVEPAVPAEAVKAPEVAKPAESKEVNLAIPEGSLLSKEQVDKISAYAKDKGLSQEQAQELLNSQSESVGQYREKAVAEFEAVKESWKQQAISDAELGGVGGKDFQQNVELAHRALSRFGAENFKSLLDESGYGNHPEVIRVFSRIGKAMSEATIDKPNGFAPPAKKSHAQMLYGETDSKKQ